MRIELRLKQGNIDLVGLAIILMLLGSLVIVLSPRQRYHAPYEPTKHTHSFSFNVSLDESERVYPIEPLTYFGSVTRIGITDLETNETLVRLAIQNGLNVTVFSISSVSQITNSSLVVPASEDFRFIVTREIGDANGSLVILIWEMMPPPAIDPIIVSFFPAILYLLLFSIVVIWKIVKAKTSRQSIRPFWVALLVIVGLILLFPYINGALGGFFTPIEETEQFTIDRSLMLNGTNPYGVVPFGSEVPNNTESFRIQSVEDENKKYYFELVGANYEVILSATHENSSIAWEILGDVVSQEHSLSLNRVDADVDVSLSIESSVRTTRIPVDPLPSAILAIMGVITLILAIVTGLSVQTVQTRKKMGQN